MENPPMFHDHYLTNTTYSEVFYGVSSGGNTQPCVSRRSGGMARSRLCHLTSKDRTSPSPKQASESSTTADEVLYFGIEVHSRRRLPPRTSLLAEHSERRIDVMGFNLSLDPSSLFYPKSVNGRGFAIAASDATYVSFEKLAWINCGRAFLSLNTPSKTGCGLKSSFRAVVGVWGPTATSIDSTRT